MYLLLVAQDGHIINTTFASPHYAILEVLQKFVDILSEAEDKGPYNEVLSDHYHGLRTLVRDLETNNISDVFDQLQDYGFEPSPYHKDDYNMEKFANGYFINIQKEKDGSYFLYANSKLPDNPIDMVRLLNISHIKHDDRM